MCLIESVSWFLTNSESSLITRSVQGHWAVQVICKPIVWERSLTLCWKGIWFFKSVVLIPCDGFYSVTRRNLSANHSHEEWGLCSSYRNSSLEQFIKMLTSRQIWILPFENSGIPQVTFSLISATSELKGLGPHGKGIDRMDNCFTLKYTD